MLVLEQAFNRPRVRHYVISFFKFESDCRDSARFPFILGGSG